LDKKVKGGHFVSVISALELVGFSEKQTGLEYGGTKKAG